MRFGQLALFFVAALSAAGCLKTPAVSSSSTSAKSGKSVTGYAESSASPGAPGFPAANDSSAPPASPTMPQSTNAPTSSPRRDQAAESLPKSEERPGLATAWGETRHSPVREVSFVRADPTNPFAVVSIHYNDRAGLSRLVGYREGSSRSRVDPTFAYRSIRVTVRDAGGSPLEAWIFGGRPYVVGQPGERYAIDVQNPTPRRFEVVASVDGLDVMDGKPASMTTRGYLIAPYGHLSIEGFRRSDSSVAAFRFSSVADSYAAKTGDDRNVGIIGVAFFGERGADYDDDTEVRDQANPFPGSDRRYAQPPPY